MNSPRHIAVIGLGYVGLPVAVAMAARHGQVIAFDIDPERIAELVAGHDRTGEVAAADLQAAALVLTCDPARLAAADFFIVTVPTPITGAKRPDLGPLLAASRTVGRYLKPGAIVVYESTVYPGATEEDCAPILAAESGLEFGRGFSVGYSPERINPGDRLRRFDTIAKVVSGSDPATLDVVADVYGAVVTAGVHRAPSIAVAEAAKVIENTQRDLNIALMNELSIIFHRLGIDTHDVLAAAGTKWNFLPFTPGLVGGHCIGVDPYYLTHRAEQFGYHPEVILAGRRINDGMGLFIARETVKHLLKSGARPQRVAVLGLTFKEDVPDIRNTRVIEMVRELESFGLTVQIADPLADPAHARREHEIELVPFEQLSPADAVVLAVAHQAYRRLSWDRLTGLLADGRGLVVDIRGCLDRAGRPDGVDLWRP
jgi:UDP-N-acetyl-D-glucosamine/UDP-N-acetyl-D-galactosamine dehydrogenase